MRRILIAASMAVLLVGSGAALAQEGAATGAAAGAITGGVVGGPVGAAVGAAVGGATGGAADQRNRATTGTVVVEPAPSVSEKNTTCVQGSTSSTCTSTETRR
jgi:phage tail tape-measure protein